MAKKSSFEPDLAQTCSPNFFFMAFTRYYTLLQAITVCYFKEN